MSGFLFGGFRAARRAAATARDGRAKRRWRRGSGLLAKHGHDFRPIARALLEGGAGFPAGIHRAGQPVGQRGLQRIRLFAWDIEQYIQSAFGAGECHVECAKPLVALVRGPALLGVAELRDHIARPLRRGFRNPAISLGHFEILRERQRLIGDFRQNHHIKSQAFRFMDRHHLHRRRARTLGHFQPCDPIRRLHRRNHTARIDLRERV